MLQTPFNKDLVQVRGTKSGSECRKIVLTMPLLLRLSTVLRFSLVFWVFGCGAAKGRHRSFDLSAHAGLVLKSA